MCVSTDLEPLVLLALCVQVVQVEDVDHLLLLEEELLDLAGDDSGRAAGLGKVNLNLGMLVGWFWGALFSRTADPIFHESLCLHPVPLQGYVPRPFILI